MDNDILVGLYLIFCFIFFMYEFLSIEKDIILEWAKFCWT